jgi:large subunit ribosomal protein L46
VHTSSLRSYSAAAAEATSSTTPTTNPPNEPPTKTSPPAAESSKASPYLIKAGIILTRPPLLTRELTPFETSFFFYQKRLAARLTLPFQGKAWFKEGTPSQLDFAAKLRERKGYPSRELGEYNGRSACAWDDELLVGDTLSKPETLVEGLLEDSVMMVSEDAEEIAEEERVPAEKPMPRRTAADEKNDTKALERWLDRTLYFVVKEKDGRWGFPSANVSTSEALHEVSFLFLFLLLSYQWW